MAESGRQHGSAHGARAPRQPEVMLVAGRNGTGKTTLARELVSSVDARALCVVAPSGEWGSWEATRTSKGVVVAGPQRIVTRALSTGASAIVLDDCDAYLTGVESEFWRRLLSTNRHLGVDVVLITRRPQELPRWSIAAATRLYVLRLGPRESAWCVRTFGIEPPNDPAKPHMVRAISL